MDKYVLGIIPRIRALSSNINKTELFVDKTWLLDGSKTNYTEFTFLRDNSVVKSLNSTVTIGTWRLLPTGKMIVNIDNEHLQLEPLFLDKGLFILNMSGNPKNGFILYNESVVKEMTTKMYLEGLVDKIELEKSVKKNESSDPIVTFLYILLYFMIVVFGISYMTIKY